MTPLTIDHDEADAIIDEVYSFIFFILPMNVIIYFLINILLRKCEIYILV